MGPQERHAETRTASASSGVDLDAEAAPEADGGQPRQTFPDEGLRCREGAHFREVSQRSALGQEGQGARPANHETSGKRLINLTSIVYFVNALWWIKTRIRFSAKNLVFKMTCKCKDLPGTTFMVK